MAFTQTDLNAVEQAIRDWRDGKAVVSLTLTDRVERRMERPLEDLLKLRDLIKESVDAGQIDITKRRPRVYRARYSKGI